MFPIMARAAEAAVFAGEDLPAFASTPFIPLEDIVQARPHRNKTKCEVMVREGALVSPGAGASGSGSWVRAARLAPDCHSVDLLVRLRATVAAVQVQLQTVREVQAGHQLRLWFDEACLAAAGIPFLTPVNIQGEKNYVCHLCSKRFESPNPLKIHLALECGAQRRVELWKRLCQAGQEQSTAGAAVTSEQEVLPIEHVYDMKLTQEADKGDAEPPEPQDLSTSTKTDDETDHPSSEMIGRYSAFKPYLGLLPGKLHVPGCQMLETSPPPPPPPPLLGLGLPTDLVFAGVPPPPPPFPHPHHQLIESQANQRAVEMETLVSNMGRSKQGHLCIYCGKIYSRKYGLKIHIRTHTGFKPLKCKFCLRPFGDPSNLNKHVRLHSDGETQTPYKCEECGKVLVRRRDLDRHIKSRHQECTS